MFIFEWFSDAMRQYRPGRIVVAAVTVEEARAYALNQEAVYIRYLDGVVEIVPINQDKALNSPRLVQIGDVWKARDGKLMEVRYKITSADAYIARKVGGLGFYEYLVHPGGAYYGGLDPHPRDLVEFVHPASAVAHVRV